MSDARQILESIIDEYSVEKFKRFFREKSRQFTPRQETYSRYDDDNFTNGLKIGEVNFSEIDSLLICAFKVTKALSERAGKKAQYEKAKGVLKSIENQRYSAGIFIFYDISGNFRFSLVYPESIGARRQWNHFRRFTYFVSKEFTNKTFKSRIGEGDFSSIEKIREAFSVEKVTKDFYKEIAYWYFWACKVSNPPEGATKQENGKEMFIIRLVTRIIFVWFMRQKDNLVPNILFDKQKLASVLKDFSSKSSTYYKAILQNLFFATLSTKKEERDFRSEVRGHKGYNPDFGNQYVYRYFDLFQKPEKIQSYFRQIPFLNGGLFECLDNKDENEYLDGFTERKKYQPNIPNYLFFGDERKVNLNNEFGTKNKIYKVRGFIDILSSFNFTIDENTPDDQDVALDPELLGRVFENLLASFNPETSTTARKATGSYYTPREIVEYMVTESLKEYFKTHLANVQGIDKKLETLFATASDENPFTKTESKKLVELIESVRIVDPAVGSGAFPMGALNKMVFILNKVDPGNELWKQAQLDAAEAIPDQNIRNRTLSEIEEYFQTKKPDYWRKLYLIQKCIYGVDIQQIAVEIAKLRFFISLLVDEDERDIQPLPNLDFKIMQGNSLVELISYTKTIDNKRNEIVDKLGALKDELFNISDPKEKKDKREEIDKLLVELFEYERTLIIDNLKQKIKGIKNQGRLFQDAKFEKDDKGKIKELEEQIKKVQKIKIPGPDEHFEWHINFSEVFQEKGGFDVVIANPPYVRQEKIKDQKPLLQSYELYNSTSDLYVYFYERSYNLLKDSGILTFISSNKWMRAKYGEKLRCFFKEKTKVLQLIDFNGHKVFEATVDTNIIILQKEAALLDYHVPFINIQSDFTGENLENYLAEHQQVIELQNLRNSGWSLIDEKTLKLKHKIETTGAPLKDWGIKIYRGIITGFIEAFIISESKRAELIKSDPKNSKIIQPLLKGKDIERYSPRFDGRHLIVAKNGIDIKQEYPSILKHLLQYKEKLEERWDKGKHWSNLRDCDYYEEFEKAKIIYPDISDKLTFAYDTNKYYADNTAYILGTDNKYILAVLNSSLINFYYGLISSQLGSRAVRHFTIYVERIPIKKISKDEQQPFIDLVDKILAFTKDDDYLENPAKQAKVRGYEKQIDELVYKLYGLTPEEIEIVEKS